MGIKNFEETLKEHSLTLNRGKLKTLQINIGRFCNLACHHCHVEAGPLRTERMNEETAERIIQLIKKSNEITTVDLTGGAPELNPHFRSIVVGKYLVVRHGTTARDRHY